MSNGEYGDGDGQARAHMLHYLAVGQLALTQTGEFASGKHVLLCHYAPKDESSTQQKAYKAHCKAIMNKGANKLQPNKRIRLTSDANDYDLQVVADVLDEDKGKTLVFFAITAPEFPKHHAVTTLLKDFKSAFYEQYTNYDFGQSVDHNQNAISKSSQGMLNSIFNRYDSSKLREVEIKVEAVKSTMRANVDRALGNVEQLEELETKSEQFQEHARQFQSNSTKLKNMFRCRYYKINLILALFVIAIIAYVIYAIYSKVHG